MTKPQTKYLALLRGINVGGKNVIKMSDLTDAFEALGLKCVRTYIQSGNILFRSTSKSVKNLTNKIEKKLSNEFSYNAKVVVLSETEFKKNMDKAHSRWGVDDKQKHNAMFTVSGVKPKDVLRDLPEPVSKLEKVSLGPQTLFWSASKTGLSRTTMLKLAKSPRYQELTVRNSNTVFKLCDLFDTI